MKEEPTDIDRAIQYHEQQIAKLQTLKKFLADHGTKPHQQLVPTPAEVDQQLKERAAHTGQQLAAAITDEPEDG